MSLPNFLQPGSPPRSPHGPPPDFLTYFTRGPGRTTNPTSASSSSSNSHSLSPSSLAINNAHHHPGGFGMLRSSSSGLRPTRRDLLICILTLSFSYLLFASPSVQSGSGSPIRPPPRISSSSLLGGKLLSSAGSNSGSGNDGSKNQGGRLGHLPSWGDFFSKGTTETCSAEFERPRVLREPTYGETVRSVGMIADMSEDSALLPAHNGKPWDEGEEELEDDEFQGEATLLMGHSPGWTLMDNLYLFNGSFYVITDQRDDWPELRLMTSTGLPALNEPGNEQAREPKGDEIIFITPFEANLLWGQNVYLMRGATWLFNDGQFIDHYYHFAAELLLGTWRTYASLDQDITSTGETSLPPPRRIWFLHQSVLEWRDKPRFNPTIMYGLFPNVAMLYPPDFADLCNSTSSSYAPKAYRFERALLADRSAAFRGPYTGPTARTVAGALQVGTASRWWWEPLRRQMLRFSGVPEDVIARNLEGIGAVDPAKIDTLGPGIYDIEPLSPPGDYKPVVTYISRQHSRRRLTAESHEELVAALEERAAKVGFDLVVIEAERITKEEQIALAAKTTIMLGVHGNGLTHLLWMPATPRSAVIEMFFKGGFARDYQYTAHAIGIRHFAVQHDISFTAPNLPRVDYPEGFQGESITVVGSVIADLIEDRLAGRI